MVEAPSERYSRFQKPKGVNEVFVPALVLRVLISFTLIFFTVSVHTLLSTVSYFRDMEDTYSTLKETIATDLARLSE